MTVKAKIFFSRVVDGLSLQFDIGTRSFLLRFLIKIFNLKKSKLGFAFREGLKPDLANPGLARVLMTVCR